MELFDTLLPYLAPAGTLFALLWLAFREIAPKTPWQWDDEILSFMEGVGVEFGVSPDDLIASGNVKRDEFPKREEGYD